MKSQANKSRSSQLVGRKPIQSAPLTRLVVRDALHSWVVPTTAAAISFTAFVLYSAEVVEEPVAVTTVGIASLLTLLFFGLRSFLADHLGSRTGATLVGFAALWLLASSYPFYRTINPGTPVFSTGLSRGGPPITLPLGGRPGRYDLVVEGHFLPAEGRTNRTGAYSLALGHDGATDRVLQGAFSETWGTQRVGAGRRSSLVPSLRQTNQVREPIDIPAAQAVTLQLTELSPGVRDQVSVRLYTESVPRWGLLALGLLALAGAIVTDAWRPKGASEGLMTTMTVAAFVGIAIFRVSSPGTPGFPQLVVAALMGTLGGAVGGSLLWRTAKPLKKHLTRRS